MRFLEIKEDSFEAIHKVSLAIEAFPPGKKGIDLQALQNGNLKNTGKMKPLVTTLLISFLTLTSCSLLGGGDSAPDIPGKIVFSAKDDEGTSQIYTMNANGTDVRQLTHFGPSDGGYQPSWSPDGCQIVFSTTLQSSSNGFSLFIMDADGSNPHPMHPRPGSPIPTPGNHARWSPDGTKIVFDLCVNCQVGTNIELYIYDFATDTVSQLTDTDGNNSNPTWSPDGSRIAFVSNRDYVEADTLRFRKDLYVVDANGTNLERLTKSGNTINPRWNPSSQKIAFEWNINGNEVFVYNLADQQIYKVETGLKFAGNPLWNNRGTKLMIFGRETEKSNPEMRLLNIMNKAADILQKIELDEKAVGRDYDWIISTKN